MANDKRRRKLAHSGQEGGDASEARGNAPVPREGYAPVDSASLYFRVIGRGQPIVVLHGGPDFDHNYLLPEMDRLADSFRLIYYDQRGRGRSAGQVRPNDVSVESEIGDLESLRRYFRLESIAVLGHSWGGVLAMEYAIRYPGRVSHLILMNTAPASRDDFRLLVQERRRRDAEVAERLKALSSTAKYREGDLKTEADYYRIHFSSGLRKPAHIEKVIGRLRTNFTKDGVLMARQIERRLMNETWLSGEYDLFPKLRRLSIPTLVIDGDRDGLTGGCAAHIAQAIPGARFVLLTDSGHFAYLESAEEVHGEIVEFLGGAERPVLEPGG